VSVEEQPVFGILTGQEAPSGVDSTVACGPNPTPGNFLMCMQTWPFGRFPMDSDVLQADKLGQITNRGEFLDHQLVGNPFAQIAQPLGALTPSRALQDEKANAILKMFNAFSVKYSQVIYTGNPANTTGSGGYVEPYGLDSILNDGYQDTYTGTPCPAADALVVPMGVDVNNNSTTVVREIVEAVVSRWKLAQDLGIPNYKLCLAMRYGLFRKLTEIWPCTYYSYRCNSNVGSTNFIDSTRQTEMRDEMRMNHYLLVDGRQVEVQIDNAIMETPTGATSSQSDIYIVPQSSPFFATPENPDGFITYRECFNMGNARGVMSEISPFTPPGYFQAVSGGRYLVFPLAPSHVCIQYSMVERPRLVCRAPMLGGRLTGLQYEWLHHERVPNHGQTGYVAGGTPQYPSANYLPPN